MQVNFVEKFETLFDIGKLSKKKYKTIKFHYSDCFHYYGLKKDLNWPQLMYYFFYVKARNL